MFTLIYDCDFKAKTHKEAKWKADEEKPNIQPHRIKELWAEGEERQYLESIVHGGDEEEYTKDEFGYYGDMARTMFINL